MNNPDCPYYQKAELEQSTFQRLKAELRDEIEGDMRALGLQPERMRSQVRNAAALLARAEMYADQAAVTPLTYQEKSREGNVKPVTHPVHIQATSVASAAANALKMLGIYAAADKVSTRVKDSDSADDSPLSALMAQMQQEDGEQ